MANIYFHTHMHGLLDVCVILPATLLAAFCHLGQCFGLAPRVDLIVVVTGIMACSWLPRKYVRPTTPFSPLDPLVHISHIVPAWAFHANFHAIIYCVFKQITCKQRGSAERHQDFHILMASYAGCKLKKAKKNATKKMGGKSVNWWDGSQPRRRHL